MGPVSGPQAAFGVRDILAMRSEILQRSQTLQQIDRGTKVDPAPAPTPAVAADAGKADFAQVLRSSLETVNTRQQEASRLSEAYERGEVTDVTSVMLARQEAGVAFEATLQVRNKLLNAYQEIMRMGI